MIKVDEMLGKRWLERIFMIIAYLPLGRLVKHLENKGSMEA